MAEHEVDISKTDDGYVATCKGCNWTKENINKRPLARAISERHLLLNKIWPYEEEEQPENWLS